MMEDVSRICSELRNLLEEAVRRESAEGILLSGGLDTSIIASLARKHVPNLKAFTITLKDYDEDLSYARLVAAHLGLEHKVYFFAEDELLALASSSEIAKILDSCEESKDPVGPSVLIPTYIVMKFAKNYVSSVYTGVGADELFMGYSVMKDLIDFLTSQGDEFALNLRSELFTSVPDFYDLDYQDRIGESLGLKVKSPFLTPAVEEYALKLPVEYKVRRQNGKLWGKWILRQAFENNLPREVLWRPKVPMEKGVGSVKFIDVLELRLLDVIKRRCFRGLSLLSQLRRMSP
jgi:asparagine synthase (glutamine-hydrolysing)